MLNKIKNILAVTGCIMLSGCLDLQDSHQYPNNAKAINLKELFSGDMKAWGVIYDWRGYVTKTFTTDIKASWNADKGLIDEVFYFSDDVQLKRQWNVTKLPDDTYEATAADVKGLAKGKSVGNALIFHYDLNITDNNSRNMTVSAQDTMLQFKDGAGISRIKLSKFGIPVGEIVIHLAHSKTPKEHKKK